MLTYNSGCTLLQDLRDVVVWRRLITISGRYNKSSVKTMGRVLWDNRHIHDRVDLRTVLIDILG